MLEASSRRMKIAKIKQVALLLVAACCFLVIKLRDYYNITTTTELQVPKFERLEFRFKPRARLKPAAAAAASSKIALQSQVLHKFKPNFKLTNQAIEQLSKSQQYKQIVAPNSSRLLNLKNASFIIEPAKLSIECSSESSQNSLDTRTLEGVTLLIVVNSKWSNFARRRRMRSSWLNERALAEQVCSGPKEAEREPGASAANVGRAQFLFALGKPKTPKPEADNDVNRQQPTRMDAQLNLLVDESRQYSDLLVMNLEEDYKSMSVKHLMIFKWISKWSRKHDQNMNQTIVLKCDDDAQIDIGQLVRLYNDKQSGTKLHDATFNPILSSQQQQQQQEDDDKTISLVNRRSPNVADNSSETRMNQTQKGLNPNLNWFMCATFPSDTPVLRQPSRKWQLTRREYHYDTFPVYCSGLAYVAPVKLLERLLIVAHQLEWRAESNRYERPLWVDDAYVTGILAASLADGVNFVRLNGYFCYSAEQAIRRARLDWPCVVTELTSWLSEQH